MGNYQIENITTDESSIGRSWQGQSCTNWSDTSRSRESSWQMKESGGSNDAKGGLRRITSNLKRFLTRVWTEREGFGIAQEWNTDLVSLNKLSDSINKSEVTVGLRNEMKEEIAEIGGELGEIEKWAEETKESIELSAIQHELWCINSNFTKLRSRVSAESEEAEVVQQRKTNRPTEIKKRFVIAAVWRNNSIFDGNRELLRLNMGKSKSESKSYTKHQPFQVKHWD
jgi:hypothetical protein